MLHLLLTAVGSATPAELVKWFDEKAADAYHVSQVHEATSAAAAPTALTNHHKTANAPLKLIYMPLRGLGDLPHLVLEFYGAHYSMMHVSGPHMKELKPMLPFGRLPLLLAPNVATGETFALAQSGAIVRHLHREHEGHREKKAVTHQKAAEADQWYEQVKEAFGTHQAWGKAFNVTALREATAADLDAAPVHYRDTRNRGEAYTPFEMSIVALRTFEERLAATRAMLTGEKITYADLALFLQLWELLEDDNLGAKGLAVLRLPQLDRFVRSVAEHSKVAHWLEHMRMPRNGPHDGSSYPFKPGRTVLPPAEEEGKEEL